MRSRILIGLIAGTIGGFLGWLLQEHFIDYNAFIAGQMPVGQGRTLVYCVGGMIGLLLGAVDGVVEGNNRKLGQGMLFGAIGGIFLGFIGFSMGQFLYALLGGSNGIGDPGAFGFARQVIARSFGWAMMGLGLGVGSQLATRSPKRIWHGAIGGFLGGFLGGFVFDLIAPLANQAQQAAGASGVREVGGPSRAVGFTAIGGLTGFFIGLVEELLKQAWVKVLAGRNEGKDFILSKAMNILGRDERSDVPLFGDPAIGAQHAAIRADGNRHVLLDAGTPSGTIVNGQPVPTGGELLLRDGDMIQIGAQRILFREKATATKFARPDPDAPRAKPAGPSSAPIPSHLCPYCGGAKDVNGNCLCSPAGAPINAPTGYNPNLNPNAGFGAPNGGFGDPSINAPYGGAPDMGGMNGFAPSGPALMQIVGMEGAYGGQVFSVAAPNITIGREPGRDIVLIADSTVSRNHARLTNENGTVVLYDNGSANGTFVNGMRVTAPVPLAPGDMVQFGNSKFRFE